MISHMVLQKILKKNPFNVADLPTLNERGCLQCPTLTSEAKKKIKRRRKNGVLLPIILIIFFFFTQFFRTIDY